MIIKYNVNIIILIKYFILIIIILTFSSCTINNKHNKYYYFNRCNYFVKWKKFFSYNSGILDIINNDKYIIIAKYNGLIQVIDVNHGRKIWSRNFFYYIHHKLLNNLKLIKVFLIKNSIYLFTNKAEIYTINVNCGVLMWHTTTVMPITSKLLLVNHLLIVYSNNILQAINENNGTTKWITSFYSNTVSLHNIITPAAFFGIVVVFSSNGIISAISLDQGNIIWQRYIAIDKDKLVNMICNQVEPIIINNIIYSININNNLIALNLYSGKILWLIKIYIISNLLYYNNNIYCIDNQYNLISINMFNGDIIWLKKKINLYHITVFLMYKNYLIIGNSCGFIYIFNISKNSLVHYMKIKNFNINKISLLKKNNFLVSFNNEIMSIIINFKY
ncbi:MAG: PQQ-binding-like beta-propeller repeat protein [Candidatus Lightella neohaematopini]|nr:PQQ-binding-like beta-propeller repeat protein [Candidatus Lightella neohaematopini]